MQKITYLSPSLSRRIAGIFDVKRNLSLEFHRKGYDLEVIGFRDNFTESDNKLWNPLNPICLDKKGIAKFVYHPDLYRILTEGQPDLVHLHFLWTYISIVAQKWSKKNDLPLIITPNGMLDKWALQQSKWTKRLAMLLYEKKTWNQSACIQVNSQKEYQSVRQLNLANPICIIPNGVTLPDLSHKFSNPWEEIPALKGKKILLYLGRIHHKKGLKLLVEAWKKSVGIGKDWALVAVGFTFSNVAYEEEIITYVKHNNLGESIFLLEGMYNELMMACYANSTAFILPSFSEGIPMAVMHAWAYSKPVLMTEGCNLPIGFTANAVSYTHLTLPTKA